MFTHAEPIAWVQANRGRLLGALLTIMAGNPTLQHRHDDAFQPETRFKMWWTLVGSAVEHAAKLYEHELHFRDLFAANEEHDDEAAGLVELLNLMGRRFETSRSPPRRWPTSSAAMCGFGDEMGPAIEDVLTRATGKGLRC